MILLGVEMRAGDRDGWASQRREAHLDEADFSKTVQPADGTRFQRPPGEFRAPAQAAPWLAAARELASTTVARCVRPDVGLHLTEIQDWVTVGLKVKM